MMDRNAGWVVAILGVGGGIAVSLVLVGIMGFSGAGTYEHYGEAMAYLVLAIFGGPIVGLIFLTVAIVKAVKDQNSSPERLEKRPPEENLCRADGSKTCRWCGTDSK